MTRRFCSVFFASQVELRRVTMITAPRTMAKSCVSRVLKWNPLITIWENEPSPEVGSVVQIAIRQ